MRTHGIRFAVLQEPDGSDMINGGMLKELTGNDTMYARGLYSSGKDIKPTLKLCLICNKLPRLTADDQAIWNRTRVCPFESRFPKNNAEVPKTWDEQLRKKVFYRDATLNERFEDLKFAFIWIMFRTYKECIQTGWMEEPKKVMEATNEYRKNNDIMLQFVSENIKQDPRVGNSLTLNDVFESFRPWFTSTFHGIKMPSKNDLRDDLLRRWGPMSGSRWMGYRLRNSKDDVQEGRARVLNDNDLTDGTATEEDSPEPTSDRENGFDPDFD
jgi:phage/plasmid-associated DNA primase